VTDAITILSARFNNAEHTGAEVVTVERAAVMVSERDRPVLWAQLMAWKDAGNTIAPFQAPPPETIDALYDRLILAERLLKAVVLCINDGTLVTGANRTPAQLKTIIKARL
jgi:hypothetical protein